MEDNYSVDIRKVSPRRFGEWLIEYTFRIQFRKVEAGGGYFELDRARQVGNLLDWTIDGQWHSENGTLPPVPTVTSGKCTLIQFSLTQLDDGRQYEEPRSKILSWRVGGLPALEGLFAELQREIEQNWDALQNLKTPVFKGEIKPVHDSGAPQPAVQFTGYVDSVTGASAGVVQPEGRPVWVTPSPPPVASAASPAMPQQAADASAIEHFDFDCDSPEVAALFAGDGLITRTIPYGLDFGELQITAHDKDIARGYLYSIAFLARLKEEPPVQVGHIALIQSERGHCSAHLKITDDAHIRETRAFDFGQVVVRKYWKHKIHEYLSSRSPEGAAPRQPPADRQSNGETNGKPKGKPGRKSRWSQSERDAIVEKWEKGDNNAQTLPVFLCDQVGEKEELDSLKPKPSISESQFYKWRDDYYKRKRTAKEVITGE
jgi:hypothetical protein